MATARSGKQKNSTVHAVSTASRSGNRFEGLLDFVKTINSASQKAGQFSTEIAEFDDLTFEIKTLKADIAEKDEEIEERGKQLEEMEKGNRLLICQFREQAVQWHKDQEKQSHEQKATKAQCTREVQNAKKQIQDAKDREHEKESSLRQAVADHEVSKKNLGHKYELVCKHLLFKYRC
jgi:chromosome segregation ATPase